MWRLFFLPATYRKLRRRMSASCRSTASASWTTTGNASPISALSPQACSVAVETTPRWACSNAASGLKTSSSTAASESRFLPLCKSWLLEKVPGSNVNSFHRDSKHPEPPPGTKWKEVRHDNKVTWLVSWTENIQGSIKYIMLNPSSRIKVCWRDEMQVWLFLLWTNRTQEDTSTHSKSLFLMFIWRERRIGRSMKRLVG